MSLELEVHEFTCVTEIRFQSGAMSPLGLLEGHLVLQCARLATPSIPYDTTSIGIPPSSLTTAERGPSAKSRRGAGKSGVRI